MLSAPAQRPIRLLIVAVAMLFAAACADRPGGPIPYDVQLGRPDAPSVVPLESDYRIAPMDTVSVKVFKSQDLTGDYEVDLTGHISLPLVGEVEAANLTTAQLDDRLTQLLGTKYFENPDVSVGVKEAAGHLVTVDGAVHKAGSFPVMGPMTLMKAVAIAGGADMETANMRRVAIFRMINGQRQAAAFDLLSIQHGEMQDPAVYSGDVIIVDGSRIKDAQKNLFKTFPLFSIFRPF